MRATEKGGLIYAEEKKLKTLSFVTVLSIVMLFLIVGCNGQKRYPLKITSYPNPHWSLVGGRQVPRLILVELKSFWRKKRFPL